MPERAFEIASSWGSYMNDCDPGKVFYTFPYDKALVISEAHRAMLLEYGQHCLNLVQTEPDRFDESDEQDLLDLVEYIKAAEILRPVGEVSGAAKL